MPSEGDSQALTARTTLRSKHCYPRTRHPFRHEPIYITYMALFCDVPVVVGCKKGVCSIKYGSLLSFYIGTAQPLNAKTTPRRRLLLSVVLGSSTRFASYATFHCHRQQNVCLRARVEKHSTSRELVVQPYSTKVDKNVVHRSSSQVSIIPVV